MIKIDKDLCIGCGACTSVCPSGALQLNEEGKCECDNTLCVECEACIATCPVGAISNDVEELPVENKKQLLHFYADWCGPCKMLEPLLKEIENDIEIVHINIDTNEDKAQEYGVMSIPTLILLKDGKEVERNVGLCDLAFLKDFIGK